MSTVSIPNQIQAGQPLDPRPVMANFDVLASFINGDVLTLDGSKAMTGHLTLSGPGTAGGHAVTKAQLDSAVGSDVAGGGFLPLAGGTITGNLTVSGTFRAATVQAGGSGGLAVTIGNDVALHDVNSANTLGVYGVQNPLVGNLRLGSAGPLLSGASGVLKVEGKEVYTKAKAGDQIYTKKEIDDLLAARPLMKLCDKPTRVYDVRSAIKCLRWHKVQLPSTVGGVARSGAKAAYLNMTSINATRSSWIAVRPDGSNWDPNNPSSIFSTMNLNPGATENEHFLTEIGSNGAIQFWIHGDSSSDDGVNGLVVDVIALVF